MFKISILFPVKKTQKTKNSPLLCSGLTMVGGTAMGLWDFNLDSETIEVPSYFLTYYRYNSNGEGGNILST